MIYLITPTGARPQQIQHCAEWMQKQTYTGEVTWIIIDDCLPVTTEFIKDDFKENWKIIKVFPRPAWSPGENTQARNLSAGLAKVDNKKENIVFIIEDDDYYKPIYLDKMIDKMGNYQVIGETNTIYYNPMTRRYCDNNNKEHASLFQIAFRASMIPTFTNCFKQKFIDCTFFKMLDKNQVNLFHDGTLAIGIKGIPGRGGIGAGHSIHFTALFDRDLIVLKSLIGEDAEKYRGYYNENIAQRVRYPSQKRIPRDGTLFKARRY